MNEWIDDSDLPQLQTILLDSWALCGDRRDDRKSIGYSPYDYKNTLIMRSEIERKDE